MQIFAVYWKSYNHFRILRLFDVLPNFPFTTSETMRDYYLYTSSQVKRCAIITYKHGIYTEYAHACDSHQHPIFAHQPHHPAGPSKPCPSIHPRHPTHAQPRAEYAPELGTRKWRIPFFNCNSLDARLNSHYETQDKEEEKMKRMSINLDPRHLSS